MRQPSHLSVVFLACLLLCSPSSAQLNLTAAFFPFPAYFTGASLPLIFFDSAGSLYVNFKIPPSIAYTYPIATKFMDGVGTQNFTTTDVQISTIAPFVVDSQGNVYISAIDGIFADGGGGGILVFSPDGVLLNTLRFASSTTDVFLDQVSDLSIDPDDNIYVAANGLAKINVNGTVLATNNDSAAMYASSLAIDLTAGRLYAIYGYQSLTIAVYNSSDLSLISMFTLAYNATVLQPSIRTNRAGQLFVGIAGGASFGVVVVQISPTTGVVLAVYSVPPASDASFAAYAFPGNFAVVDDDVYAVANYLADSNIDIVLGVLQLVVAKSFAFCYIAVYQPTVVNGYSTSYTFSGVLSATGPVYGTNVTEYQAQTVSGQRNYSTLLSSSTVQSLGPLRSGADVDNFVLYPTPAGGAAVDTVGLSFVIGDLFDGHFDTIFLDGGGDVVFDENDGPPAQGYPTTSSFTLQPYNSSVQLTAEGTLPACVAPAVQLQFQFAFCYIALYLPTQSSNYFTSITFSGVFTTTGTVYGDGNVTEYLALSVRGQRNFSTLFAPSNVNQIVGVSTEYSNNYILYPVPAGGAAVDTSGVSIQLDSGEVDTIMLLDSYSSEVVYTADGGPPDQGQSVSSSFTLQPYNASVQLTAEGTLPSCTATISSSSSSSSSSPALPSATALSSSSSSTLPLSTTAVTSSPSSSSAAQSSSSSELPSSSLSSSSSSTFPPASSSIHSASSSSSSSVALLMPSSSSSATIVSSSSSVPVSTSSSSSSSGITSISAPSPSSATTVVPSSSSLTAVFASSAVSSAISSSSSAATPPTLSSSSSFATCTQSATITVYASNGTSAEGHTDTPTGLFVSPSARVDYSSDSTDDSWCDFIGACSNAAGLGALHGVGNQHAIALIFRYGDSSVDTNQADFTDVFPYLSPSVTPQLASYVVPDGVFPDSQIWLGCNDDFTGDNSGSVTVTITVSTLGECGGSSGTSGSSSGVSSSLSSSAALSSASASSSSAASSPSSPPSSTAPASLSSSPASSTAPPAPPPASVLGDPAFVGLLGQSYQVHGVSGLTYALVSDRQVVVNAVFTYLSGGSCLHDSETGLPLYVCWSHAGSYLSAVSVRLASGETLVVRAGGAAAGFAAVELGGAGGAGGVGGAGSAGGVGGAASADGADGTGSTDGAGGAGSTDSTGSTTTLTVGSHTTLPSGLTVDYHSLRQLTVRSAGLYQLTLQNSDGFVNLLQLAVSGWSELVGSVQSHGLIGQTWRRRVAGGGVGTGSIPHIEGEVDDYVVRDGLLGCDFMYSKMAC